jgi:RimJ/RimL family protein N-acetyltransferase
MPDMSFTVIRSFPKEIELPRSESRVIVRPLVSEDAFRLAEFFSRIPEEDRFYLKEDVTSAEVIGNWAQHIDYDRVVPLVALIGEEIVADATLHRHRAGARRHIGEIRAVVDPRYRNRGIGSLMVREVVDIAYDNAMDSVIFELVAGKEDDAIKVTERLGFKKVATLPNFVKDMEQKRHNLVVMELQLEDWLQW